LVVTSDAINRVLGVLHLNSVITDIRPLSGGVSASMTLISLADSGGGVQKWIVRQASEPTLASRPAVSTMEFSLLSTLFEQGVPVPRPLFVDEDGEWFGSPTLVLEYLPGEMDFAPDSQPLRAQEVAQATALIHAIDLNSIAEVDVPRLGESITELCGEPRGILDQSVGEGKIRATLLKHWPPPHSNPPVLLHGDIWSGNLLWLEQHISGVIDWEDAWIGDPLLDVAGVRLDLACTFGFGAMEEFTRAYCAHSPVDMSGLAHWDLVAALWFTRFLNEEFVKFPEFYKEYGREDITLDSMRAVVKEFSRRAIQNL
jgi:aminoglycoside phosphotransferase (APT) family kinase protein